MKNVAILLRVANFVLGLICLMLLVTSCGVISCPKATIHSLPENCEIIDPQPWRNHCEEGYHNDKWGCCQYECRQVKCRGLEGWFMECTPGGNVLIDARCDRASGQCVQQTKVSQPIEGSGL